MRCPDCKRAQGHRPGCLFEGTRNTEPNVTIPADVKQEQELTDDTLFYLPLPNTTDEGFYVQDGDLYKLLKANKNKPAAIEYIADMMEGFV